MSGSPTFDTPGKKQKRGEFKTPPYPTGMQAKIMKQHEILKKMRKVLLLHVACLPVIVMYQCLTVQAAQIQVP